MAGSLVEEEAMRAPRSLHSAAQLLHGILLAVPGICTSGWRRQCQWNQRLRWR